MAGNKGGSKKAEGEFEARLVRDRLVSETDYSIQTGHAGGMSGNVGQGRGTGIRHGQTPGSKAGVTNRGHGRKS